MKNSKNSLTFVEHPFKPVYDSKSRILILGTMPSPESIKYEFYYGHPRNRFWPVLAGIFNTPVKTKEEKTKLLLSNNIALWDVLKSCYIDKANDSSIKDPVVNDFSVVLKKAKIECVLCNGKKAFELYKMYCKPETGIEAVSLPSTSPANRRVNIDDLIKDYRKAILG